MSIDDVMYAIENVKKRVAMIPYATDKPAVTKDALTLAVDALEQLAVVVSEIDQRTKE
jgi:hypothetical protein